ncbi:50S ribosomal protein L24 [Candidatus Woesearchaeota archaeon]|nr:50S ribosomal protein L24 [Candidatus Woesearchaeota archaeon]
MKSKKFSVKWISSTKPKKQRKYRYNAPLHVKQKFVSAHLSPELRTKQRKRSLGLRVGDKVKLMRGQFKGQTGKIERVDLKKSKVFIGKIEFIKSDGTKVMYPVDPSNLMIVEINEEVRKK